MIHILIDIFLAHKNRFSFARRVDYFISFLCFLSFSACATKQDNGINTTEKLILDSCKIAFKKNNYDFVVNRTTNLIRNTPECLECYFLRAMSNQELNSKQSIQDFTVVIDSIEKLGITFNVLSYREILLSSYISRGMLHFKENRFNLTLEDLFNASRLDSTTASLYSNIGACYCKLNYCDKGMQYIQKAYKMDSTNYNVLLNISQAYLNKENFILAHNYFSKGIKLFPDNEFYFGRAITNGMLKNFEEAESDYINAIYYDSSNAFTYFMYSKLKIAQKDTVSYCKNINKALKLGMDVKPEYKNICR